VAVDHTTTRFLYDGLQAIAEYNTAGALLRRYVPGAGLDEHLAWYEGSGTADRRWLIQDDLGSVVAVTNASGASLSINAYDEYGAPAAANSGLSGYTGQMYLAQAGLYHYRARAYSPALGRFLQTDPIGMAGGMNLYAYTDNDPVNLIDPLGLQETTEAPDLTVVALRGIEDMVNSMNANQASVLIARGALLARLSRLRPRNRFPLRPDRPTDEEIEASCRWVTVPSLPGRPDDWRFRSGPTISVLATGAAITSSYDVSAQGWQVSSSGRLIPNLCGPTNCDARRRGFVFAGTQVRQVWTRGTTGRFEWMVTNNGAVPDAGGDLGGEAVIVVQKLECSE
jgi:RHS repeat-associated protein